MPMSSTDYLITFAIRVTSLAVAGYDYLETLPSALKFYHHQWSERRRRIGASAFLFFLIRISSILVLAISNYGFFTKFTQTGCDHYYLLPPAFKVVQGMVSHGILGLRAYTVSSKNKWVGWSLLTMFVIVVILEWITTMVGRIAELDDNMVTFLGGKSDSQPTVGSCRAQSVNTNTLYSAWIYYALVIVFDVATTAITIFYLVKQLKLTFNSRLSQVVRR
ncbi:hypothetical protein DL96DRAFT_1128923 [Flagelloscypha sp. PMI_526]|nr:hypothetical protein DL96DRAFT_1128923 [Flagelloscypha sp. PMI_526]